MLTSEQIKGRIGKPLNGNAIDRGRIHAQRLKFHGDTQITDADAGATYLTTFKGWVNKLLPADKYTTFCSLITTPLATNELAESIYTNLYRVFDGKNSVSRSEFKGPDREADFEKFFDRAKLRDELFRAMRSDIDAVVVCDRPAVQAGPYPAPYYYMVSTSDLVDIGLKDEQVEYVIFKVTDNYLVIDDTYWRMADKDGNILMNDGKPVEIAHGLGYCPARMIWSEPLASDAPINHKAPITSVLGDLDRLLFNYVSKEYADMYAGYPIMVSYEQDEEVKGDEKEKPKGTKSRDLLGPGTHFTVTPPLEKDDVDLNANPIQVISGDVATLEYLTTKNQKAREAIFKAVVGADGEQKNDTAKNEKQIEAGFESRKDVLMNLKKNFERTEKWVSDTLALLRYGEQPQTTVDYGSDFYLTDEDEILGDINEAKTGKAPDVVVGILTEKYLETVHRNDPDAAMRARIILDLDPYPMMSRDEAIAAAAYLDPVELRIKVQLDALIRRFEAENTLGLLGFGEKLEYKAKINEIKKIIRGYEKQSAGEQAA